MDPKILDLTRADPRYPYEAYEFVCEAVTFTQDRLGRTPHDDDPPDADYHVRGDELARGACDLAVREFGLMAGTVFRQWGIAATDDIGNLVFNLIRGDCLSRSDDDAPADFHALFDLETVLAAGFELTLAPAADPARPTRKGPR